MLVRQTQSIKPYTERIDENDYIKVKFSLYGQPSQNQKVNVKLGTTILTNNHRPSATIPNIYRLLYIHKRPTNRPMGKGCGTTSCRNGTTDGLTPLKRCSASPVAGEVQLTLTPRYHLPSFRLSHFDHMPCSNT